MFTKQTAHRGKSSASAELNRPELATHAKESSEVSPLWQSLALSRAAIQPKLAVSQPDDPYEQEADRVADRVMRMADIKLGRARSSLSAATFEMQRKCASCEDEEEELHRKEQTGRKESPATVPSVVYEALNSPGQPLDTNTRSLMESRFDRNFANVRVHADEGAAQSARAVGALAYTVGQDLLFDQGQYAPHNPSGQRLLAHELTHTLQQDQAGEAHSLSKSILQRQPAGGTKPPAATGGAKAPPPVAGGNVLYIGMNNYKPEVARLKTRFAGTSVKVSTVTVTEEETKTKADGATYDLTTAAGIETFANTLYLNGELVDEVKTLLSAQSTENRDDLAHVISVYNATEKDGADRLSRVVLSGHSYGTKVYNEDVKGAILFNALVKLATIFPTAAGQTKHLLVLACLAGEEDLVKNTYTKAFPNLKTFWGYTNSCPTGAGAADKLSQWADITDVDPTKLAMPPSGQANWAMGVYQSDAPIDGPALMTGLRGDESKFNEYFAGTKVDPDNHSGFLFEYYRRARTGSQHTSTITGADHDYAQLHADQSFRLRFWPAMVSNFWKKNGAAITRGYGTAAVPNYATMSRKAALAAIASFDTTTTATGKDKDEAARLLKALKVLDAVELNDNWLTP